MFLRIKWAQHGGKVRGARSRVIRALCFLLRQRPFLRDFRSPFKNILLLTIATKLNEIYLEGRTIEVKFN